MHINLFYLFANFLELVLKQIILYSTQIRLLYSEVYIFKQTDILCRLRHWT